MIQASIYRNKAGQCTSFTVANHGESYVCAAVSMLVINTINSIEAFTDTAFSCDMDEEDVRITFTISPSQPAGHDAELLLKAMLLGLTSVAEQHPNELTLNEFEERE